MTPEQLILKTIRDIHSEGGHPNLEAIGTEALSSAAEKFLKILGGRAGEEATPNEPAQIEGPPIPRYRWNSQTQRLPIVDQSKTQRLYDRGICPVHNTHMYASNKNGEFACQRIDCVYGRYVRD